MHSALEHETQLMKANAAITEFKDKLQKLKDDHKVAKEKLVHENDSLNRCSFITIRANFHCDAFID